MELPTDTSEIIVELEKSEAELTRLQDQKSALVQRGKTVPHQLKVKCASFGYTVLRLKMALTQAGT